MVKCNYGITLMGIEEEAIVSFNSCDNCCKSAFSFGNAFLFI